MRNIKFHKINIPNAVIEKCWHSYLPKYKALEAKLIVSPNNCTSGIFENHIHTTGAFQMSKREVRKLRKTSLMKYFCGVNNNLAIELKSKIIFRGTDYYIGMRNNSNLCKVDIIFRHLEKMTTLLQSLNLDSNLILVGVLLDYIRNYLLILLYFIHKVSKVDMAYLPLSEYYQGLIETIENIEEQYIYLLMYEKLPDLQNIDADSLLLKKMKFKFKELFNKSTITFAEGPSFIRKNRECDHPWKLLMFAKKIGAEYLPRDTVLLGIEYGGIELPFIVNAYRKIVGKNPLEIVIANVSGYSSVNTETINNLNDVVVPFSNLKPLYSTNNVVLLDDSVTTGRTIELLCKVLPNQIRNIYFGVVSFTNSNRFHHLSRDRHGGVNYVVLDNSAVVFKSEYTQTYSKDSYTNRYGVFDRNKNRIIRLIDKNFHHIS